ncbi:MAG TPA: AAA family ATPase [Gemmatimonadaceae bacterium]|nr:AAA family ATPase [Gemmatimonadaceae bacterium]
MIIVGGINGSGKSTLTRDVDFIRSQEASLGNFQILNPDIQTASYGKDHPLFPADALNLCAVLEIERRVWQHIAEGSSCLVETVLSSGKFVPVVTAAQAHGFRTKLIYCGLPSVELAVARVKLRVKEGGHSVPAAKVRSRWQSSMNNFVRFSGLVDEVVLFNNERIPTEVGHKNLNGPFVLLDREALPDITARIG